MKVLIFGSCNIDYVYSLDHIVLSGETETTNNFEIFPGGKGLNQAIAAAKAGAKTYFAGCVGYDGEMLTRTLKESGVDISLADKIDEKNGHAIIQVSKTGENSIFLYPGSNEKITRAYVDSVFDNFSGGDIILLQNEINNIEYIVEKAYKKNMCIILNPSPFDERMKAINFNHLTYIILNEVEARAISGYNDTEKCLEYIKNKYPKLKTVLTLGVNGCVFVCGECELYQSAYEVDAVDTTAAGDTFTGYFAAGLAEEKEYAMVLKTAAAAAALAVSRKGAAPSIPKKEEVYSAIENLKKVSGSGKAGKINQQIDEYIEKNIRTANIGELSEILGYSIGYTGRLVKKLTGKSFPEKVRDKRCGIAAEKLLNTDMPIAEIIDFTGYKNESYFRKCFKEKFGKNPLEFRKKEYR